jgi:hypothetical protein
MESDIKEKKQEIVKLRKDKEIMVTLENNLVSLRNDKNEHEIIKNRYEKEIAKLKEKLNTLEE